MVHLLVPSLYWLYRLPRQEKVAEVDFPSEKSYFWKKGLASLERKKLYLTPQILTPINILN